MPFDPDRFVNAQAPVWDHVRDELSLGMKTTHWMWFVFPQLAGLGRSDTARFYALDDIAAARGYLAHPLLGARLREAVDLVLAQRGRRSAAAMFGATDAMKLRSSLTLFALAGGGARFDAALAAFFDGPDAATLRIVR